MNFIESYKKGQSGGNKGLYLGDGCKSISDAINGLQRANIITVAGAPKSGKSTLVDYAFVIEPYLDSIAQKIDLEIIYHSYEIDRVSKEFDFASHFLFKDYGMTHIKLPTGVTKNGKGIIELSSKYLRGRITDDKGTLIKVSENVENALKSVYMNRIVPLFGEYDSKGNLTKKGAMVFLESRNNPTGIRNDLVKYAETQGTVHYAHFTTNLGEKGKRIAGYTPNNPNKFVLVVVDHCRKILLERGFTLKQAVDKHSEYSVDLRNQLGFSFIQIIHLNRSMSDVDKIKYQGDLLFPDGDSIKESGNLSEDSDYVFTIFSPNDPKYKLDTHFGLKIKDNNGNDLFPLMKTIHLVESRHCEYPAHFRVNMKGNIKSFEQLNIKTS